MTVVSKVQLTQLIESHRVALFSASQAQQIDQLAIVQYPQDGYALMEQAGEAAFLALLKQWPKVRHLLILCGKGNNGGDGFVLAKLAVQHDIALQLVLICDINELKGAAKLAAADALALGLRIIKPTEIKWPQESADCVIIDALVGTGLTHTIRPSLQQLIAQSNASRLPVLSIDIPSGISASTGAVQGIAIRASTTITMIVYKQGLFTGAGPVYSGQIYLAPLQTNNVLLLQPPSCELLSWSVLRQHDFFSPRARDAHKGNFGHVLIIGGDHGFGGAIILAAGAALRSGAGLVSVLTRPEHVSAVLSRYPEAMVRSTDAELDIPHLLRQADVIVIGPGLGQGDWGLQLLRHVLALTTPVVLDADALNILAKGEPHNLSLRHSVLTPHPGEAARLLHMTSQQIQTDRFTAAAQLAQHYSSSIVLKGLGSLIQTGLQVSICHDGNPGMASGGMGDVLSGIMGSLWAQNFAALPVDIHELVCSAVCLHSHAADIASQDHQVGLLASDVVDNLRARLN